MATGTAAITDKEARAAELREEIRKLAGDLQPLKKKLAEASGALAILETRRDTLAREIADGKPQRSGAVAALHTEIETAKMPVEVLQKRVAEKESALTATRDSLAGLEREIFLDAQRDSQVNEVRALAAKGMEAAQKLNTALGAALIALSEYEELRPSFARFMGADPELTAIAREALAATQAAWVDGTSLREERRLKREGFFEGGGDALILRHLRRPK